jgi:hypothetical protein
MPRISADEFERLPLRAHDLLADVPLHDAWAVDLPHVRSGITLDEFLRAGGCLSCLSGLARTFVRVRLAAGALFGWDRQPCAIERETFASRLTPADRSRSLRSSGACDGPFQPVYRFKNEQLVELVNRTVHAAALSALVESPHAYRFYYAVYVRRVGRLTPVYMAVIDPFRRAVVYPSLLRHMRTRWDDTFGTA